jgi:hypothetical protein
VALGHAPGGYLSNYVAPAVFFFCSVKFRGETSGLPTNGGLVANYVGIIPVAQIESAETK